MIYGGEYLKPLKNNHRPDTPRSVSVLQLAGGPSRQPRETVKPFATVTAEYLLDSCFAMEWFRAWWRVVALEGGATVTAMLSVNGGPLAVYNVQFTAPAVLTDYGYRGTVAVSTEVISGPVAV